MKALLDTSVLVGLESERVAERDLPEEAWISSITLAELHLGVLATDDPAVRRQRLATLAFAESEFVSIPVDQDVARSFAGLADDARRGGRKVRILDTLIAATALSRGLPVITQDAGFHAFAGVDVIRLEFRRRVLYGLSPGSTCARARDRLHGLRTEEPGGGPVLQRIARAKRLVEASA